MITLDTNVWVRVIVGDEPAQTRRAEQAVRDAIEAGGAFIPELILVELVWVLARSYKFERARVAAEVERLIATAGLAIENDDVVLAALEAFRQGAADFSDYVVVEHARRVGATPVRTFDERFGREADVELL